MTSRPVAHGIIRGQHCGQVWAQAVARLLAAPQRKVVHQIIQITDPGVEDPLVRAEVEKLLAARGLDPVSTVVNTLFPAEMARTSTGPEHLAARYRAIYPRIRAENRANKRGTYFGRLVEHPCQGAPADEFTRIYRRLTTYGHGSNHAATVYEGSLRAPGPADTGEEDTDQALARPADGDEATIDFSPAIYNPKSDSMPLGFPCLVHLSFQHVGEHLHLLAQYRSQYMIRRGYGNYLALGLLQRYLAESAGFRAGTLTVVTGQAEAEGATGDIESTLAALTQLPLFTVPTEPDSTPRPRPPRRTTSRRNGADDPSLLPDQW
ncbi:hypothetical protein ACPZ19_49465 [Amycolatopsis lurida]